MQIASRILLGGVRRAFITRALYIARIGLRIHASIDTEYGVCVCVCVCVCVSMYIVISLLFAYRFRPSKAKKKLRIRFFFIWPLDLSRRMVLMFDIFSVLHVIPYCYILRERVCECVHKNMPMNETLYFRYVSYCTSHTNLIMWFLFRYSCIMLFTNTHTHTHTQWMHAWMKHHTFGMYHVARFVRLCWCPAFYCIYIYDSIWYYIIIMICHQNNMWS